MLVITLSLVLGLAAAPALALSNHAATAVGGGRFVGQTAAPAIEEELAGYLDEDDIAAAQAYVTGLAERGEIDDGTRRTLEDRIWRTKTERTLEYARKIREAIRDSDLDAMRAYNARMQRLTGTGTEPVRAGPVEEQVEGEEPEAEVQEAAEAEGDEETVAVDEDGGAIAENAEAAPPPDAIADLVRRGEEAIETYHLSIAPPGTDSAIGMVAELMTFGDEGQAAAQGLAQQVMAIYETLIERDVTRGRLGKAATFAERMGEIAERAGLPRDEADALEARIAETSAARREHDRLMQAAAGRRDRGRLVAPENDHALAFAAEALRLGVDPAAAEALLDDIIERQRARAAVMTNDGRFRDAAVALNGLGDALLAANVGETTLVADLRAKASALYRRADLRDRERERAGAAGGATKAREAVKTDENGSPFTFINPF